MSDEWADLYGEWDTTLEDFWKTEDHDNQYYCEECEEWFDNKDIEEDEDYNQVCSNCGTKLEEQ